jgi:hypothetical protein
VVTGEALTTPASCDLGCCRVRGMPSHNLIPDTGVPRSLRRARGAGNATSGSPYEARNASRGHIGAASADVKGAVRTLAPGPDKFRALAWCSPLTVVRRAGTLQRPRRRLAALAWPPSRGRRAPGRRTMDLAQARSGKLSTGATRLVS